VRPTPATRVSRSGTGNAATMTLPTRRAGHAAVEPTAGLGDLQDHRPPGAGQRGLLHRHPTIITATPTPPTAPPAPTPWSIWCGASSAGAGWTLTGSHGRTAPATAAATATAAPQPTTPTGQRPYTCAKIVFSPASPSLSSLRNHPTLTKLVNHLRAHGVTILCNDVTCTLDTGVPTSPPEPQLIN
jgi:hypothetical protein